MGATKTCTRCKIEKPQSKFYKNKTTKDRLRFDCKDCCNTAQKKYKKTPKGKEIRKNSNKKYKKTIKGQELNRNVVKEWQKTPHGKETNRKSRLKRYYGITLKDYYKILEFQGGVCAICSTNIPGGKGRFHIDHCHKTREIRGLLCHNCNLLLGHAKDSIQILVKAITYLHPKERWHGLGGSSKDEGEIE